MNDVHDFTKLIFGRESQIRHGTFFRLVLKFFAGRSVARNIQTEKSLQVLETVAFWVLANGRKLMKLMNSQNSSIAENPESERTFKKFNTVKNKPKKNILKQCTASSSTLRWEIKNFGDFHTRNPYTLHLLKGLIEPLIGACDTLGTFLRCYSRCSLTFH